MKHQNCGPRLGKLVHQFLEVVTLAYNLCLAIIIPRFEDIKEDAKKKTRRPIWEFVDLSVFHKNLI